MNRFKLAIIGGSYLQLPLVQKAKTMNIETHCFAWQDGAVCQNYADFFYPISVIEKETILQICKDIHIDGIITIASDVAALTVNYISEKLNLVGNSDQYSLLMTNKYKMRQCFRENNIPIPQFKIVTKQIVDDIALPYPVIVKPTDRSGSRGVQKVNDKKELSPAINRAIAESFAQEAIVEEFVEGREISVETISWQGEHYILAITDKITTGAPYFVELEHHQPSSLPEYIQKEVKGIVLQALNAIHVQFGASHSELKITPNGKIYVIEIGARMGGDFIGSDLVKLSTGYDFLKGVIEIALNQFNEPVFTENHYAGVYFLCHETKYVLPVIQHKANYPAIIQAEITDSELHTVSCSSERSGYFIYRDYKRFEIQRKSLLNEKFEKE